VLLDDRDHDHDHDRDDDDDHDDDDVDVDEGTMVEAVILVSEYSCNRRNDTPFFFSETRSSSNAIWGRNIPHYIPHFSKTR
jgi:hypothetical protein